MSVESAGTQGRVFYIARQPIYDRKLQLFAFELLYRGGNDESAGRVGITESASTLSYALMEIGLGKLVGDKPAFVNIPSEFLMEEAVQIFPKGHMVLEILEDTDPTALLTETVRELKKQGFSFALDDFTINSKLHHLVPLMDVVKVDVLNSSIADLQKIVRQIRRPGVLLLAEKVESSKAFEVCRHLGFDLFQGYFFSKPSIVKGKAVACNRVALLALLAKLSDPDVSIQSLEEIIETDLGLSYRLLKFLRSASAASDTKVSSVRQAVMMLGLQKTAALAAVLVLSGITDMPSELLTTALLRAKMCEETATRLNLPNRDQYFTVGLLSFLDAFLDMPMEEVLPQLPLDQSVVDTLLGKDSDGQLARVLRFCQAVELGNWEEADACGLNLESPSEAYMASVAWADELRLAA